MRHATLADWLAWQETLHPRAIDLGLERVGRVLDALGGRPPEHLTITVAGTNGKGSSVAMLDAIYRAAGHRVGAFFSPHLLRYNERIRIDGREVEDARICAAFAAIDAARGDVSLSYFEFSALAALHLFREEQIDVAVLEVGLGGRLDAVNVVDADCAIVTSIDIDHTEWLGTDRESIGFEKAGIFRPRRPAICADPCPPVSVRGHAERIGADWLAQGRHFGYRVGESGLWDWWGPDGEYSGLSKPALPGAFQLQNAAGVLMTVQALQERRPVPRRALDEGLRQARLAGRMQVLPGAVPVVFDVAHNPAAARALAGALAAQPVAGRTLVVLGMLADKDVEATVAELGPLADAWFLGGTGGERGLPASVLARRMGQTGVPVVTAGGTAGALALARAAARAGDRILVTGSFPGVAEALAACL